MVTKKSTPARARRKWKRSIFIITLSTGAWKNTNYPYLSAKANTEGQSPIENMCPSHPGSVPDAFRLLIDPRSHHTNETL